MCRLQVITTKVAGNRAFIIAIIDLFSRKVFAYNVVNTMDTVLGAAGDYITPDESYFGAFTPIFDLKVLQLRG